MPAARCAAAPTDRQNLQSGSLCCPLPVADSTCTSLLLYVGISAALSVAVVFLARPLLHGPMALLANFVSVPFEVRFSCWPVVIRHT